MTNSQETKNAIDELESGKGMKFSSVDELFEDMEQDKTNKTGDANSILDKYHKNKNNQS